LGGQLFQILVERILEQVVVEVADEVNEALLLRALERIVGGVEVRTRLGRH